VKMENKKLKFASNLVPLILLGQKTSTWRMFDDKDLKTRDHLIFINLDTNEEFAQANITKVKEKKFSEIENSDFDGHEKYASYQEMLKTYRGYYGDKVGDNTIVKIIEFKLDYGK